MTARSVYHLVERAEHEKALKNVLKITAICGRRFRPLPEAEARKLPLCSDCDRATRSPGWSARER